MKIIRSHELTSEGASLNPSIRKKVVVPSGQITDVR